VENVFLPIGIGTVVGPSKHMATNKIIIQRYNRRIHALMRRKQKNKNEGGVKSLYGECSIEVLIYSNWLYSKCFETDGTGPETCDARHTTVKDNIHHTQQLLR
jgi:hypothetical protein